MKKRSLLRSEGFGNFAASVLAILAGLVVGLIVLLISNPSKNPAQAFGGFGSILLGAFTDAKNLGQVFYFAAPIIMTGLSVGFANRTGLFNIGAAGQFITGAFMAVYVGVEWKFLPGASHWIVALGAAALAGALWGSIPGLLKAFCNVNEVIACIMTNYIGMYLVNFLVSETIFDSLRNQSMRPAASAVLPKAGLDQIFRAGNSPSSVNIGIFIAILAGIVMWIVLSKTRFGYELKACGYNRDAARYAGINEKRCIVYSMAIAGALSGIGGALLYLSGAGKGIEVLDILAAEGFNGIPVALLGLSNPIGIIFSGVFVAYLNVGGFNMQLFNFAPQAIEIIIAVIIYFSALALVFRGVVARLTRKRTAPANEIAPALEREPPGDSNNDSGEGN